MIMGDRASRMLKYQKAKAKLVEYNIPKSDYPKFPMNSNDLSFLTTYILSAYSEYVIEEAEERMNELYPKLVSTAQYYDAAINTKDRIQHDFDFYMYGSVAYLFSNDYGSAKVLSKNAEIYLNSLIRNPQQLVLTVLLFLLNGRQIKYTKEIDLYAKINNRIIDCFNKGAPSIVLFDLLEEYRTEIYSSMAEDDVFYIDVLFAIIKIAIKNSSWLNLPKSSNLSVDVWKPYLQNSKSVKLLWPAQLLIADKGILHGENAVVQLPTGVGKTKGIELIIRSAFFSMRAFSVMVVAPLRALCNEITMDLNNCFSNEVSVNQLSDVLQNDFELDQIAIGKKITICTPEKLFYILHHKDDYLEEIDLFIFDEGHMFDDGDRGASFELLITHIKEYLSEEQQFVLLSAVLPNAKQISDWLFDKNGVLATDSKIRTTQKSNAFVSSNKDIFFFSDNKSECDYFIPRVLQQKKLKKHPRERKQKIFPDLNDAKDIAIYNALKLSPNGGVAIYMSQQRSIKTIFERIIDLRSRGVDFTSIRNNANVEELKKLHSFISEYYGEDYYYSQVCELGILPHSSIIPNGLKIAIEYALKKKLIFCVVCTSTLAQGVNIPIRYLLITSLRVGQKLISVRDFQNLMGRTARSGIYTEGSIIITDPKIYDNRNNNKNGGNYNWKESINLFDSNHSEPCGSSILSLVKNISIDYETDFNGELFVEFIIKNKSNNLCFTIFAEKLYNAVIKEYPRKANNNIRDNIFTEIMLRQRIFAHIENYLCLSLATFDSGEITDRAKEICYKTLAYGLADKKEKVLLEKIFVAISEKIEVLSSETKSIYSYAMIGITLASTIESWIENKDIYNKLLPEDELLEMTVEFFVQNHTIKKCADKFEDICKLWIEGKTPILIHNITECDINSIDDLCSKTISYQLSFFIGNICDLIIDAEMDYSVENKERLSVLQKKIKYGVKSITEISICEKIFYDRILASKIAEILGDEQIDENNIIASIKNHSSTIIKILEDYPVYFTRKIRNILEN